MVTHVFRFNQEYIILPLWAEEFYGKPVYDLPFDDLRNREFSSREELLVELRNQKLRFEEYIKAIDQALEKL